MSSLIDEIRKALKGEKKSEFIDQLLKEKELYDALKKAGITVNAEDTQERAVLRPYGVLSKVQKIDQVDSILNTVGIDIKANSLGNLPIDIVASSLGNIPINIKANDFGNLPIDLKANSLGNLPIDIKASSILGGIPINITSNDLGNLPIDIVASSLGNIPIAINANNIGNIPIDLKANSFGTLPIDIVASTLGNLPIDIKASSIVGGIPINITSNSLGNIPINIKANDLGDIPIAINANNIGNIPIDLKAQSVDMNIKTSSGANIVIDKLTDSAYTEDRRTLSNNGSTPTMVSYNYTTRRGKFFPRGARGFINTIEIYCDNNDTSDHTFTVYITVQPDFAPIFSATLTVPAGASAGWRSVTIKRFWNYDSIFIYVRGETDTYPRIGYDTGTPNDAYTSSDEVTWSPYTNRFWIRVNFTGQTVGDLPVSGTVNTVEIAKETTSSAVESLYIEPGNTYTLITINEPGKSLWIWLRSRDPNYSWFWIEADGEELKFYGDKIIAPATLQSEVITKEVSAPLMIGRYDTTNNNYSIICTLPIQWKRKLEIKVLCPSDGTAHYVGANIVYLRL